MKKLIASLLVLGLSTGVQAAGPKDPEAEALRERLSKSFPGLKSEDIKRTPVEGLFEISRGLSFGYATKDGKFFLDGDLIDLDRGESLTENSRKGLRLKALKDIGEDKMIVFPAKSEKHVMTVFTDIDCGYCRKLHREIDDYNQKGITVRYLFYPRSGPNTPSFNKAEHVWCASDRHDALTRSKQGQELPELACSTPVLEHFRTGQKLGVRGTPALILDDGSMQPGYVPAARLAQMFDK